MITKTDIEKYFLAEKQAGLLLLCIAVISILIALACLLVVKSNTWKGIAIPFLLFAVAEAAVGYQTYRKSDSLRIDNVYALDMNPAKLTTIEIPRVQKIKKELKLVLVVEVFLFLSALFVIMFFKSSSARQWVYGIGVGVIIQSVIALGISLLANNRAKAYYQQLQALEKKN